MKKLTILTVTYIIGVIIGALFLDIWGAKTSFIKTISIFIWTIIFLISLFYSDKHESKIY
jgi:MFS family permease